MWKSHNFLATRPRNGNWGMKKPMWHVSERRSNAFLLCFTYIYSYEWIINWNYQYAQITLQYMCKYMYNVWHIDDLYENVRQRRRWGVIKSRAWLQFNLTLICIFFIVCSYFCAILLHFFVCVSFGGGVGKVIQLQVELNNNSFSLQVCLSSYLMKYITRIKNWSCLSAFAALKIAHSKVAYHGWYIKREQNSI